MDPGKKEALTKVSWGPTKSCGTCHFGQFAPGQYWGLCGAEFNKYIHSKHDREHQLPANRMAVCDKWAVGDAYDDLVDFLT